MLNFDHVTKSFGSTRVVDQVSLDVTAGSVTALVGHNGAGKTTLMKMALGLVRPDSGRVSLGGVPAGELGSLSGLVGASLDASALPPSWRATTLMRVAAGLSGVPTGRAADVLDLVGLGGVTNRQIARFSMGMRQRLALALALLSQPRVLILDEPTNALDPVACGDLRRWIREHAGRGGCVLISSHNLPEIEAVADRVVVLQQGRLISDAAMTDLLAPEAVLVRAERPAVLAERLTQLGRGVEQLPDGALRVTGATADEIGELSASCGLVLRQLAAEQRRLSDAYQLITTEGATR